MGLGSVQRAVEGARTPLAKCEPSGSPLPRISKGLASTLAHDWGGSQNHRVCREPRVHQGAGARQRCCRSPAGHRHLPTTPSVCDGLSRVRQKGGMSRVALGVPGRGGNRARRQQGAGASSRPGGSAAAAPPGEGARHPPCFHPEPSPEQHVHGLMFSPRPPKRTTVAGPAHVAGGGSCTGGLCGAHVGVPGRGGVRPAWRERRSSTARGGSSPCSLASSILI